MRILSSWNGLGGTEKILGIKVCRIVSVIA